MSETRPLHRGLSTRRTALASSAGAALAGVLGAACGTGAPGQPQPAPQSTPRLAGKIVFAAKNETGVMDYLKAQIDAFQQKTPGAQVEIFDLFGGGPAGEWPVRLKTMMVGSPQDAPEVLSFEVTQAANLYPLGALQPFDDLLKRDSGLKLADLQEPSVKVFQDGGRQMGIPNRTDVRLWMVNKTLLERYGARVPGIDWTVEQLVDASKAVTRDTDGNGEPDTWGFDAWRSRLNVFPFWWLFGAKVIDDAKQKALYDAPESREALQWWMDAAQKHKITWAPSTPPSQVPSFVNGQLAFEHGGPSSYGTVRQRQQQPGAAQFEWDILPQPKGPRDRATLATAEGYYLRKGGPNPDLGWAFIKHLMSRDAQQMNFERLGNWPARKDLFSVPAFRSPQEAPKSLAQVADASLAMARIYPMTPDFGSWTNPPLDHFKDAMDGKISATEATQRAQQAAQDALSKIRR